MQQQHEWCVRAVRYGADSERERARRERGRDGDIGVRREREERIDE